ncbi:YetF domain-containing protein [Pseudokineococcus basanitobsidens]|uniref:YetF domain-containing protein n=1 Tax=Pseudokineococcus basanitobsidens TaxID=1926649 RepID=A0ABU8RLY4_9ACTN
MWFDAVGDLVRVALVGTAAYAALVAVLRLSGKRTLAKLNAFDLVVTVALGSTLATILLSADVAWTEGVLALVLLVALQLVVAQATTRVPALRRLVTAAPTLLLHEGRVLEDVLRRQRVSTDELRQAVRASGSGSLADVGAVVLESDGSLSVVPLAALGDSSALADLPGRDAVGRPDGRP